MYYFPTEIQQASTWNPPIVYQFGQVIAEEVLASGCQMLFAPGLNIDRTPLNGRTFEYYSEDPYLTGKLGVAAVQGIQSKKVAACIKHFCCNNQEAFRHSINAQVSNQTLQELYLPAFKKCVEHSDPWGLMSAYNKVNGLFMAENKALLQDLLVKEWHYRGMVLSDAGGTRYASGIRALIEAGISIELDHRYKFLIPEMQALKAKGEFPDAAFDENIRRYLCVLMLCGMFDDPSMLPLPSINTAAHIEIARQLAQEGTVLLKNENHLLPLDKTKVKKICLLGKELPVSLVEMGEVPLSSRIMKSPLRTDYKRNAKGSLNW